MIPLASTPCWSGKLTFLQGCLSPGSVPQLSNVRSVTGRYTNAIGAITSFMAAGLGSAVDVVPHIMQHAEEREDPTALDLSGSRLGNVAPPIGGSVGVDETLVVGEGQHKQGNVFIDLTCLDNWLLHRELL